MRILVIEDEAKLANAIKRALITQKYAVDTVHDGNTGLDMALGEEYDLILLDVMLPGKDGLEICKTIREKGMHTPVIMLTAKGQISDKVTGLDIGADDYIVKPFSLEELFARIRALIRRPKKTDNSVLRHNDLTLDPINFRVTKSGKNIPLSSKEFSLLEYLLRNKNTVLSREQIINHVWNYDSDILITSVEVHIKHIRDKVENKNQKLIKTIRGRGYSIGEY